MFPNQCGGVPLRGTSTKGVPTETAGKVWLLPEEADSELPGTKTVNKDHYTQPTVGKTCGKKLDAETQQTEGKQKKTPQHSKIL